MIVHGDIGFQFCKKSSVDLLYNDVHFASTTVLYLKMVSVG